MSEAGLTETVQPLRKRGFLMWCIIIILLIGSFYDLSQALFGSDVGRHVSSAIARVGEETGGGMRAVYLVGGIIGLMVGWELFLLRRRAISFLSISLAYSLVVPLVRATFNPAFRVMVSELGYWTLLVAPIIKGAILWYAVSLAKTGRLKD